MLLRIGWAAIRWISIGRVQQSGTQINHKTPPQAMQTAHLPRLNRLRTYSISLTLIEKKTDRTRRRYPSKKGKSTKEGQFRSPIGQNQSAPRLGSGWRGGGKLGGLPEEQGHPYRHHPQCWTTPRESSSVPRKMRACGQFLDAPDVTARAGRCGPRYPRAADGRVDGRTGGQRAVGRSVGRAGAAARRHWASGSRSGGRRRGREKERSIPTGR